MAFLSYVRYGPDLRAVECREWLCAACIAALRERLVWALEILERKGELPDAVVAA